MDISLEKVMPSNIEMEKHVLGYILVSGELDLEFESEDFYLESHRRIWRKIDKLAEEGKAPDLMSIVNELRDSNEIEAVGGVAYVASLTDGIPLYREGLGKQYLQILRECRARREGVSIGHDMMNRCYNAEEKFKDIVDESFSRVDSVLGKMDRGAGPRHIAELVQEAFHTIEEVNESKASNTGFKTHFHEIDNLVIRGFQKKEMGVIAGRPGTGKTSAMLSICRRMAERDSVPQIIFSLEMAAPQLILRLISDVSRVPFSKIVTGFLSKEDWNNISRAAGEMSNYPVYIDDTPALNVSEMRSRIRRLNKNIPVMWVDYLQLINPPRSLSNRPDVEKISNISTSLKTMSRTMDMAVVALAQLSRKSEDRKDPTPKVSDLRQSGQIEQDADLIILLHRKEKVQSAIDHRGITEVIVGKQRNGPIGDTQLAFATEFSAFEEVYPDQDNSYTEEYF
jgi:replicative DNA helicase